MKRFYNEPPIPKLKHIFWERFAHQTILTTFKESDYNGKTKIKGACELQL